MPPKIPIKVLVITLYEADVSGEKAADAAAQITGEFCLWRKNFFAASQTFAIRGAFSPLLINRDHCAGIIAGVGKANAAMSLTATLSDPRFDFSQTYFLVAGCAGISPAFGTLGDVIIADISVDFDLTYRWEDARGEQFSRSGPYALPPAIKLHSPLVRTAATAAQTADFAKPPREITAHCRHYAQAAARANPTVKIAASVTSDSYWHGEKKSAQAAALCAETGGEYGVSQMEDHALALTLKQFGFLERCVIARGAVNFDQPFRGQTIAESLNHSAYPEFALGITNVFRAGEKIVAKFLP